MKSDDLDNDCAKTGFASSFGTIVCNANHINALLPMSDPEKDATYLTVTPPNNDDISPRKLTVGNVPVDGFWSISVYKAHGYFEKNPYDAYSVNNLTGRKGVDGSMTVQFGGCDGKIPNCLPITKGWNYIVRLYRPRAEILNGTWKFPEAQPTP